jgi:hypothetical protein
VEGRGTEEVKTNDVTGRVKAGEVGVTVEFGRPGYGVWFHEIQKMTWALAKAGVEFEKRNPVFTLMSDVKTGDIRTDILNEKVMSAIVEIKIPIARIEEIVGLVREVEKELDTVVCLGFGVRCDENGDEEQVLPVLRKLGYNPQRGKTNTGVGRITNAASPDAPKPEMVGAGR